MRYTWDQRDNSGRRVGPGSYLARGVFWGQPWDDPAEWTRFNLWTQPRQLLID